MPELPSSQVKNVPEGSTGRRAGSGRRHAKPGHKKTNPVENSAF